MIFAAPQRLCALLPVQPILKYKKPTSSILLVIPNPACAEAWKWRGSASGPFPRRQSYLRPQ